MIKKRLKKMIIALLCVALGISTLTPMDDTNAATIVYTRKKTYILSDSAKIKRFTCNATKKNYNPALKKVSMTFTNEGKYTIKYVTGKNKKKTCVVYIDSKKPVVSGVKNGEDYESKVSINVSDKVSGVASVTLNGEKMGNKFTVSEAGDYKLVAKDKCNNKTVVNFSVIEDEPEETPVVITAEPNLDDPDETVSPEPTEDPNGGTVVIGGTSTPVATSATTTDAPKGTATPNVKTTASPAPTAKETEKPATATATPTMAPTATPTVVPATPTPVPDDLAELDANWDYKINVKEKSVTLNDYKGESTNVYVKKSYKIEGQDLKAVLAETVRKYGAYIPEHAEGPFAGHNGYSNAKIETVEFEDGFDFGESIDNLFWGNMFLTKVVGLKGNIKSMESTFRSCDLFNQNIEIPSTVTNMNNCFRECSSLNQEIKIPASVISMSGCFIACKELEVAPKISALSECVIFSSVFVNCEKFNPSSFSIPPLAETIAYAFRNCESLNIKIAIPDSVVDGTRAFSGCKSLETMPTNTCSTGLKKYSYMFYNCSGIKNAYFHLRNFEEMISTFEGCSGFIKDERGNYDFIIMGGYPADDGFDVSNYKNIFKNCCKGEIKVNPGNTAFWKTLNSNENVDMYIYSNIYGCRQCDKK